MPAIARSDILGDSQMSDILTTKTTSVGRVADDVLALVCGTPILKLGRYAPGGAQGPPLDARGTAFQAQLLERRVRLQGKGRGHTRG